jgi:hypothetical protein
MSLLLLRNRRCHCDGEPSPWVSDMTLGFALTEPGPRPVMPGPSGPLLPESLRANCQSFTRFVIVHFNFCVPRIHKVQHVRSGPLLTQVAMDTGCKAMVPRLLHDLCQGADQSGTLSFPFTWATRMTHSYQHGLTSTRVC